MPRVVPREGDHTGEYIMFLSSEDKKVYVVKVPEQPKMTEEERKTFEEEGKRLLEKALDPEVMAAAERVKRAYNLNVQPAEDYKLGHKDEVEEEFPDDQ